MLKWLATFTKTFGPVCWFAAEYIVCLGDFSFVLCLFTLELRAANNQLVSLPLEVGYLINLEKLHLQKNKIKELPEVFTKCRFSLFHHNNLAYIFNIM